jgi:hypothetical protein
VSACRIDGVLGGLVLLYGHSSFYYPLAEMSLVSMAAPAAALQALNPIDALLSTINTNPYFIGCMMVLLNLGGRFLSMEVTKEQEKFFQNTWVRGFLIFVVLVVATPVYDEFVKIYPEFEALFGKVFSVKQENIYSFVTEYICGKVISGSKPSFQGFLNFGSDATVLRCVGDYTWITYTIRSGGRVQVNTPAAKDTVSGKFLLFVDSSSMSYPFTITEEVTGSSVTITPEMSIKPDTFPEIKFDYILRMMENYQFGINLNPSFTPEKIMGFITDPANQVKVMKYLFSSHPKIDKEYEKLSDEAKLLFNCYEEGYTTIKTSLINMTYEQHSDGSSLGRAYANQGGGGLVHSSQGGGAPPRYYEASSATPGCGPPLPLGRATSGM